ncbi:MAG: hypothetical protein V3R41_00895 [Gammaproteobacteria bacterium]
MTKSGFGDCTPIIVAATIPVKVPIISAKNRGLLLCQVSFQNCHAVRAMFRII